MSLKIIVPMVLFCSATIVGMDGAQRRKIAEENDSPGKHLSRPNIEQPRTLRRLLQNWDMLKSPEATAGMIVYCLKNTDFLKHNSNFSEQGIDSQLYCLIGKKLLEKNWQVPSWIAQSAVLKTRKLRLTRGATIDASLSSDDTSLIVLARRPTAVLNHGIYDLESRTMRSFKRISVDNEQTFESATVSPDGKTICYIGVDGGIYIIDDQAITMTELFLDPSDVTEHMGFGGFNFSKNGSTLYITYIEDNEHGSSGCLSVFAYDLHSKALRCMIRKQKYGKALYTTQVSNAGRYFGAIVATDFQQEQDYFGSLTIIVLTDKNTGKLHILTGSRDRHIDCFRCYCMGFSSDEKKMYVTCNAYDKIVIDLEQELPAVVILSDRSKYPLLPSSGRDPFIEQFNCVKDNLYANDHEGNYLIIGRQPQTGAHIILYNHVNEYLNKGTFNVEYGEKYITCLDTKQIEEVMDAFSHISVEQFSLLANIHTHVEKQQKEGNPVTKMSLDHPCLCALYEALPDIIKKTIASYVEQKYIV